MKQIRFTQQNDKKKLMTVFVNVWTDKAEINLSYVSLNDRKYFQNWYIR